MHRCPPAVQAELAILGLSAPAAGPATAGVPPRASAVPEQVHDDLMDGEIQHEDEGANMYSGDRQVFDEYTGDALPAGLVAKAREE